MSFGGNGDYINTGTLGNFGISSDTSYVTFAGWVKSNGNGSSFEALTGTFNPPSSGTGYQIYVDGDIAGSYHKGYITFYRRDESGNARGGGVVTNTGITDGNWHFLVVQVSNSSQSVYLDNVSQTITMLYTGDANNMANFVYPLVLGARNVRGIITNYLTGSLDDVRIYNRALTTSEITRLYNMGGSKLGVTPTDSLDAGLVGHWDFDGKNVTSTTVADTSGNGNTGTIVGDTKPVSGKIGQGFDMATTGYINAGNNSSLKPIGDMTISIWVNPRTLIGHPYKNGLVMFKSASQYTDTGFYLWGNSGEIRFQFNGTTGSPTFIASNLTLGSWNHIVVVRSGNSITIYKNNNIVLPGTVFTGTTPTYGTGSLVLGWASYAGELKLDGVLDDVRIYNRALTQSEITRLYNMGR
jgi:hypothetical protein